MANKINLWIKAIITCVLLLVLGVLVVKFVLKLDKSDSVFKQRYATLDGQIQEDRKKISALEKENVLLKQENKRFLADAAALTQEYTALDEENRGIMNELQETKDQVDLLIQANENLTQELEATQAESDKLAKEMGIDKYLELEQQYVKLEREKLALERKYSEISRDFERYQKQSQELEKERAKYKPTIDNLNRKIKELKQANSQMASQVKQTQKESDQAIEKYKQQAEYYQTQYEKTLALLEKQIQRWGGIEENYANLLKENKDLRSKTKTIPRKLSELNRLNKEILQEKAVLHYNLGVFYSQQEDYEKAIIEFQEVLKVDPNDSEAHYNLGVIYSEYIFDRDKAIAHFKKYLGLTPEDDDSDRARKYLLMQQAIEGT